VLTVCGGSVVASIDMSGSYTTSSFHLASGSGGTVEILGEGDHDQDSDKPDDTHAAKTAAPDLKQWFDPNATFAGTVAGRDHNAVLPVGDQQNSPAQTTTDTTGTDLGNPVGLANYMASTFVGQGGWIWRSDDSRLKGIGGSAAIPDQSTLIITSNEATSGNSADPDLSARVMLLRFHRLGAVPEQIRHRFGAFAIGISENAALRVRTEHTQINLNPGVVRTYV
jgi:hypothetical protein